MSLQEVEYRKKILIHIGLGKTGTTLFQKHLFNSHPDIKYLGGVRKASLQSDEPLKRSAYELLRAIIAQDSTEFKLSYWKSFYNERVYPFLSEDQLNLISEEWLSLTPVCLVRGDRGLVAERLHEIMGRDARILMMIRNQRDVIRSLYINHQNLILPLYSRDHSWSYRNQMSEASFSKLLLQTSDYGILSKYKYYSLSKKHMNLFGSKLLIRLYEDFNNDQEGFLQSLAHDLGIDGTVFKQSLPAEKVKKSTDKPLTQRGIRRYVASALKRDGFTGSDVFSGNFESLRKRTCDEVENRVQDFFRKDNKSMSQLIDKDLGKYGYPC